MICCAWLQKLLVELGSCCNSVHLYFTSVSRYFILFEFLNASNSFIALTLLSARKDNQRALIGHQQSPNVLLWNTYVIPDLTWSNLWKIDQLNKS